MVVGLFTRAQTSPGMASSFECFFSSPSAGCRALQPTRPAMHRIMKRDFIIKWFPRIKQPIPTLMWLVIFLNFCNLKRNVGKHVQPVNGQLENVMMKPFSWLNSIHIWTWLARHKPVSAYHVWYGVGTFDAPQFRNDALTSFSITLLIKNSSEQKNFPQLEKS